MFIPQLLKLEIMDVLNDKNIYHIYDVPAFYLEDNNLYLLIDNSNNKKYKMRCIRNFNDKYKVFTYKTSGRLSKTKYFLLDANKEEVSLINEYLSISSLTEWIEYLLAGGTLEEALKRKKSRFNPADGI